MQTFWRFNIVIFNFLFIVQPITSQQFSVLTCSRGDEIYSTFGHSAIRYQDSSQGIDWVYNYGLFDFHDPNFIPKFCMGKLDYMVGKESMNDFMAQYVYQQREVKEQVLNLQPSQRDSLLRFLEWNILDENKYYRYDFLFNNCATKIIDVIEQNCKGVQIKFYEEKDMKTFREHIHSNAENSVPWIDWGMDVALGMPVDRKSTAREYCFLPEFVDKSITLSKNGSVPLKERSTILIPETKRLQSDWSWLTSPHCFTAIIFIVSIYLLLNPKKWDRLFFATFFLVLGIGGFVIGFEWFFTEHSVTKNNLNLLWLNPVFIVYAYTIWKEISHKKLDSLVLFCLLLSNIISLFHIQDIHTASTGLIVSAFCIAYKRNKLNEN